MTAVGRHYGSEVSLYSIWNEPNHPAFLLPQFNANGTPASPRIYRGLFEAAYAYHMAGHADKEGEMWKQLRERSDTVKVGPESRPVESLKAQIAADCGQARVLFGHLSL